MEYKTIILPTRPQVDTVISIFVLKHFGESFFPGIKTASYEFMSNLPAGASEESLAEEGRLPIDIGGGRFDHHNKEEKTTVLNLLTSFLAQGNNPALIKLKKFVERDDFYGKGIISSDPLDRAFGLPGLIACLNKKYSSNPAKVLDIILPVVDAYYEEEEKRAIGMPLELKEKIANGKARVFNTEQRGRKLKCIFIESDNISLPGFLRSKIGGEHDVIAIRLSSGHTNILTSLKNTVDLRSLAVLIRLQEAEARGVKLDGVPEDLAVPGKIDEVLNWYYDTATNSLLNGGPNPSETDPTGIASFEFEKIMEIGLSEKLWSPSR
jgi:hypothetical protein